MRAFINHTGLVATMDRSNVDTDQIIPKQFLKRIERTGFGQYLFFDWRFDDDGNPRDDFELNQPKFAGASILLTRWNFGCGSSREHAVWAVDDYGFRAVIAESFADIFFNNCFKNGVLPIPLPKEKIDLLFAKVAEVENYQLTIDLDSQVISDSTGLEINFDIDPFRKHRLLNGLDDIAMTLEHESSILEYEQARGYQPVG